VVSPLEREVFEMRTMDAMTLQDIADKLGLGMGRVQTLVRNLKKAGYNTKKAHNPKPQEDKHVQSPPKFKGYTLSNAQIS